MKSFLKLLTTPKGILVALTGVAIYLFATREEDGIVILPGWRQNGKCFDGYGHEITCEELDRRIGTGEGVVTNGEGLP